MVFGANMRVSGPIEDAYLSNMTAHTSKLEYIIVDYILFITAPVTIKPNVNEVCDVKWVDAAELQELMTTLDRECASSPSKLQS